VLSKIISCGETGVEQAAHDVAIDMDIPYGGWITEDRKTEKGPLPPECQSQKMPAEDYTARRKQNVMYSDGTLIVTRGRLAGVAALVRDLAEKYKRPWLHVDLEKTGAFYAVSEIVYWAYQLNIDVLNVAGPDATMSPEIYRDTVKLLKAIFYMDLLNLCLFGPNPALAQEPRTVEEAVDRLILELPLKDRVCIAREDESELSELNLHLGRYIRDHYGLQAKSSRLMESCRSLGNAQDFGTENASAIIIKELWKKLRMTHKLRIVSPS
jgi:Circularly permutated YpsA SLOG family/Domain of unknown function (DUF6794)